MEIALERTVGSGDKGMSHSCRSGRGLRLRDTVLIGPPLGGVTIANPADWGQPGPARDGPIGTPGVNEDAPQEAQTIRDYPGMSVSKSVIGIPNTGANIASSSWWSPAWRLCWYKILAP